MIKNIIFDLGGVLIDVNSQKYLRQIGLSEEEVKLFPKLIWGSEEWIKGDAGVLTYEQVTDSICKNNPEYAEKLRYVLDNKDNNLILSEIPENCNYVKYLKNEGFKIFFLSNVNKLDLKYDKENFEILNFADGAVYSCDVGCAKPEKRCYELLIEKYNLVKEECVFIDDNLKNIEASKEIGITSIQFKGLDDLKGKMNQIMSNIIK